MKEKEYMRIESKDGETGKSKHQRKRKIEEFYNIQKERMVTERENRKRKYR